MLLPRFSLSYTSIGAGGILQDREEQGVRAYKEGVGVASAAGPQYLRAPRSLRRSQQKRGSCHRSGARTYFCSAKIS